jgi:hypothetical protein
MSERLLHVHLPPPLLLRLVEAPHRGTRMGDGRRSGTSSMHVLARGPSQPPHDSTTNPRTTPLYLLRLTASPAFAATPGLTCDLGLGSRADDRDVDEPLACLHLHLRVRPRPSQPRHRRRWLLHHGRPWSAAQPRRQQLGDVVVLQSAAVVCSLHAGRVLQYCNIAIAI